MLHPERLARAVDLAVPAAWALAALGLGVLLAGFAWFAAAYSPVARIPDARGAGGVTIYRLRPGARVPLAPESEPRALSSPAPPPSAPPPSPR